MCQVSRVSNSGLRNLMDHETSGPERMSSRSLISVVVDLYCLCISHLYVHLVSARLSPHLKVCIYVGVLVVLHSVTVQRAFSRAPTLGVART